jgi:hypothetical protein
VIPISRQRRIVYPDTASDMTQPHNNSADSSIDNMLAKVMEELESSDYVSTLRDPDETYSM